MPSLIEIPHALPLFAVAQTNLVPGLLSRLRHALHRLVVPQLLQRRNDMQLIEQLRDEHDPCQAVARSRRAAPGQFGR
jgi:hypothetical protein